MRPSMAMKQNLTGNSIVPTSMPLNRLFNFSFLGAVIAVVIAVFLIAALVGPIANFTTGITIAHTGFTPNPNVTASPGTVPILQLYPFLFVVLGLVVIYKYAEAEMPRGGL